MSDTTDDALTPGEVAVRIDQFARMAATHHTCGGMPGCAACFAAPLAVRVKRFNETTGALSGGNRHPDRCICQTLEKGRYADTPHVHRQEPPFGCGRCECPAYVPAIAGKRHAERGDTPMTQDAKPLTFTQPPSDPNACGVVYYVSVPMSRCQNAKPCADHPQAPSSPDDDDRALRLARRFHDLYEELASQFGYETRTETQKFDAESANGRLMIAVCRAVLHEFVAAAVKAAQ